MISIVVSSSGRKLGKTLLCCGLIRALGKTGTDVAFVKLSKGTHGAPGPHAGPGREGSDTHRAAAAGASIVLLYRYPEVSALDEDLSSITPSASVVIWESASILDLMEPDLHIHLADAGDKHPRSFSSEPDLFVRGPLDETSAVRISRLAVSLLGRGAASPFSIGGKHWIDFDGEPLFGEGRISLLRAVDAAGSILGAARSTGIPYKRAWLLLRNTEERLGVRLVTSGRGGSGGGGSVLTVFGRRMLELWDRSGNEFREMLDRLEI